MGEYMMALSRFTPWFAVSALMLLVLRQQTRFIFDLEKIQTL